MNKEACRHSTAIWNKDLHGLILLVDPGTRVIYANEGNQFFKYGIGLEW